MLVICVQLCAETASLLKKQAVKFSDKFAKFPKNSTACIF
ncbi:hypothetical protein appser2_14360 [Actinobacillus pleuropneumoniae serovar 2 str. S1536]|nr:hypothetical protein appser2_14360 [Actinobacillus pleuropneumoniae serovar 2 str. S1536]